MGDHFVDFSKLVIATAISKGFEENSYIVHLQDRRDALVIDPGLDPEEILRILQQDRLEVAAILNTHGHADHIAGNQVLKKQWPDAPIVIGEKEKDKLTDSTLNLSAEFGFPLTSPPADILQQEGDRHQAAGIEWSVLEIPGHSPGHIAFHLEDDQNHHIVFVGDILFSGSIGRTDFHDGDHGQLLSGIKNKLLSLPEETVFYPGHGPKTTVERERRYNPFLQDIA